ncbi:DUF397 domain-containing protein [Streptomyces varsoviensis]|uniref:DUF397 domain-containing protein n=1 Tax=Streptomyces varsoviensis TaxID=67373 RepID=UPI0033FEC5A6
MSKQQFQIDLNACGWRKSSYSNGSGGACVEVADDLPVVPVRDSKLAHGPVISFPPEAWAGFVSSVKDGTI